MSGEASTSNKDKIGVDQAKALDKVTDHVPDKQLDETRVKQAITAVAAVQQKGKETEKLKDKALTGVKVKRADLKIIIKEFEVDEKVAEKRLKECKGNLKEALKSFL